MRILPTAMLKTEEAESFVAYCLEEVVCSILWSVATDRQTTLW